MGWEWVCVCVGVVVGVRICPSSVRSKLRGYLRNLPRLSICDYP